MKLLNRKVGKTGRKSGFVPAFLFSTDFTPFRVVRVFRGQNFHDPRFHALARASAADCFKGLGCH